MTIQTVISNEMEHFLTAEKFVKYLGCYKGCPDHGEEGNCECSGSRSSYWIIDGKNANAFVASIGHPAIVYLFMEKTGVVRKIGEGEPRRILANLKAHYNHGPTKSARTKQNRLLENSIAKTCRLNGDFFLYVKPETSKAEARATEAKIKSFLSGWLDYDQGGDGIFPTT